MKILRDGQLVDVTAEEVASWRSAPIAADVVTERERRLAAGFDYDFGDERGIHRIGTTDRDMAGWDEVMKIATSRYALGSSEPITIVPEAIPVQVTPVEWFALLEAANAFRQPIWLASFALQALDPIPADFADDRHWP